MTSIDRTAYPRFRKKALDRELATAYTPTDDEIELFNRKFTKSAPHRLAYAMLFKSFQRLGYLPAVADVPAYVVVHLRTCLKLRRNVVPSPLGEATYRRYQKDILKRCKARRFGRDALHAAAEAMAEAAAVQDHPADIINASLAVLGRERFELPAYSTLDRLCRRVRTTINTRVFAGIDARLSEADKAQLDALLDVPGGGKSLLFKLKKRARKDSATNLRALLDHLDFLDGLVRVEGVLDEVPHVKRRHFAAEAAAMDASELRDYGPVKRRALLASLLAHARATTRDEIAEMFIRRMAKIHRAAKDALELDRLAFRERTDAMVATIADVIRLLAEHPADADAGRAIRHLIEDRGGIGPLLRDCEALMQFHGDRHLRYILKPLEGFRSLFMRMLRTLEFVSTTEDTTLIDAMDVLRRHGRSAHLTESVDLGFAIHAWRELIIERAEGAERYRFDYFQACVFSSLANELRSGDIAIVGAIAHGDYRAMLVPWDDCETPAKAHCDELGLPAEATEFVAELRERLRVQALTTDADYLQNGALVIDPDGEPHLKRHAARPIPPGTEALAAAISERMPVRGIVDILWDVHCWTDYTRQFGPVSGSEPKLESAASRYVVTLFAYGCNLGPAQTARHMRGAVSSHQIGFVNRRHIDATKLEAASRDVVNAFAGMHLPRFWGDGSSAAADGTQHDLYEDNALASYHVRYGGVGGIAYHHVSDTYVALFTQFLGCGVWEGVHILDMHYKNSSDLQPDRLHADTQGQSLPIFALAYLLGIQLMPRIRNWKDYRFFRPDPGTRYDHIEPLFRESVDWELVERHFKDLLQVVVSIRAGRIAPSTLLRKLGNYSRKNRLYHAFKALGTAVRTLYLLRYIQDEPLRVEVTASCNKAESFNGFSKHLRFGGEVITQNDPIEQEKAVKYTHVVANAVILWNSVHQTRIIRALRKGGWKITAAQVACLSPYPTQHIKRFGDYWLNFEESPDPIDGELELDA
ncbi:Tn3 family transposase [Cognatilysobacter terrigena]|uniref:Tn3 family transposase n=1 Tax=Cognatilysobacter terrigena TaxID=2488749 RepID=UPI00105B7926|nr:Tn3 family transposase [Lysobacter terrigena]